MGPDGISRNENTQRFNGGLNAKQHSKMAVSS
jgi:hypothetical protein